MSDDFERLKAQKDAIVARQNRRIVDDWLAEHMQVGTYLLRCVDEWRLKSYKGPKAQKPIRVGKTPTEALEQAEKEG